MQGKRQLLIALNLVFACGTAVAAIGDGETGAARGHAKMAKASAAEEARASPRSSEAERVRSAGETACRETVNTATALGETFRQMVNDIVPLMVQTGEQLAREVEPKLKELEPTLKDFGTRMRAMVRQLEQSYLRAPPERESDK